MRKKAIPKISDLLVLLLMVLSTCGYAVSKGHMQTTGSQATAKDAVTKSIERIIRETLKEGEGVVNGVRVWRRVPPAKRNVEELRRFGDDAVPVLTNHLSAESDRERALAVEFLGLLGGRRIIPPLQKVIQEDTSPTIRILALRWITQAPFDLVSPIIREAATRDLDEQVRKEAQEILKSFTTR
jgi:hypothetical protein